MSEQPPLPPTHPQQVLAYSQAQGAGRSGLITALGIVSIIMAALSFLGALGTAFSAIWMQIFPSFMRTVAAASTMPTTGPAAPPNPFANATLDYPSLILSLVDAVARLGLAILLFVAAIAVLRDSRSGRRLHLWWAYLRIPLAVFGSIAYAMTMQRMMANMNAAMASMPGRPPAGTPTLIAGIVGGVFDFALSCAYPTAVLIVMNLRKTKAFYMTLGT